MHAYRIALVPKWYYGMYVLQAIARKSINLNDEIKGLIQHKWDQWQKILKIVKTKLMETKKLNEMEWVKLVWSIIGVFITNDNIHFGVWRILGLDICDVYVMSLDHIHHQEFLMALKDLLRRVAKYNQEAL